MTVLMLKMLSCECRPDIAATIESAGDCVADNAFSSP